MLATIAWKLVHVHFLLPEMVSSWTRPNEDVVVSAMCVMEKEEIETDTPHKQKEKTSNKAAKPSIQPSVICGVSLRRTKYPLNCEDEGGGNDPRTEEVQLMNKVNEVVSGDTSPQIITNSDENVPDGQSAENNYLESAVFTPYLLVIAAREDVKKLSKQVSTDSLKPSASMGNIIPTLGTMSMNQDWSMLDPMYMYDSDPDCQIVKVTPAPGSLSASSPTEGTTNKQETKQENPEEGKQTTSSATESAINVTPMFPKAGSVLQCVELPQNLQSENLHIKSISPTLDRQHIVVVVGAKISDKSSKSVIISSEDQSSSSETESSFNPLAHSTSNSDKSSVEQSDVETNVENMDTSKSGTESNENSTSLSSGSDCNCNKSSVNLSESNETECRGCILIYKINYTNDHNYVVIEETPIVTKYLDSAEGDIDNIVILSRELSEHVEEEELINCDDEISVPTPSQASLTSGRLTGVYGQMAVIFANGSILVFSCSDLSLLAEIKPSQGDRFTGVTYCSGIDRLCVCSALGKLYFYQISEDFPNQSDSLVEGNVTPTSESLENQVPNGSCKSEEVLDTSPKTSGE